jgi:hypothetical protein
LNNQKKKQLQTETRVLGVILDSKLNFETHTDTVMKKVNSRTFIFQNQRSDYLLLSLDFLV